MLAALILVIGILSRVVVHQPNFSPVLALALFGGVYLGKRTAVVVPLLLMIITDLILGLHDTVLFTWTSILLIALMGGWVRERKSTVNLFGASFLSAVIFFLVTNFGSWLAMYPHTAEGLRQCFVLAIPFFRLTLASTVFYSVVLFGTYYFITSGVKETRYARILVGT